MKRDKQSADMKFNADFPSRVDAYNKGYEDAMESAYANQQKEVSDKDIEKEAASIFGNSFEFKLMKMYWIRGAKWMRDKLTI